jgi:putative membrane protein insertion efficiency factor
MGHCDSSAKLGGAGGVRAARSGIGAPAARDSEPRDEGAGMSRPARALLFLVRVYQAFFSGLMPSACKFYPSCSHYAADAVRIHGARRGAWLALRRVLRCHPFTRGGVDLVPDAEELSREVYTSQICHSERSEESLLRPRRRTEGFLASLGMSKFGALRNRPGTSEVPAPRSETPQTEICATNAPRRALDEAKL